MNFTPLGDAWIVEPDIIKDSRGSLTTTYSEPEFAKRGLNTHWPEQLQTVTRGCGNVRGMHWQESPFSQIKLVRCLVGLVTDVIVDIREGSPSFGEFKTVELSGDDMRALYIPAGFAHGFQCVSEYCLMHYCLSARYDANSVRRFHYADPDVKIPWPVLVMHVSEQDASAPPLSHVLRRAH